MSAVDTPTVNGYEQIQQQRSRVIDAIDEVTTVVASLQMRERVDSLEILRGRIASDRFKVLVLGEFKRGKSTVINALLGQKVLPASAPPTTATINEVKWGEPPRAVLHWRPVDSVQREPEEIPVGDLAKHVTVGADDDAINPYERVEVFWPLRLCADGVEIIDSPGLNDRPTREQITTDYLRDVDAIMMVFAADMLGAQTEFDAIDGFLRPLGHDHLFLIVNRINLIDPAEQSEVIEKGRKRITPWTELGPAGVFFVNARGALEARINGDTGAFAETGFPGLEAALERFLARDRGRVKILAPSNELRSVLKDLLTREIPDREAMLAQSLETLERRVDEASEPLQGLQDKRDLILDNVDVKIQGIRADATSAARTFYENVGAEIPGWATGFEPKAGLKIFRRNADNVDQLTAEVSGHIEDRLSDAFLKWQHDTLQPLLEDKVATLAEGLNQEAKEFLAQTDLVRLEIAGSEGRLNGRIEVEHKDASPLERIVAAGGGLVLGGPGAAVMGASGGVKGLTSGLLPQLGIGIAGVLVLGPGVVLLGLLAAAGFAQGWWSRDKAKDNAQADIGKAVAGELRGMQDARAAEVGTAVEKQLEGMRDQVASGLQHEITRVHEQIDVVLTVKRSGQADVDAERQRLRDARSELDRVSHMVGDVLAELAAM